MLFARRAAALALALLLVVLCCGCSQEEEGPEYADKTINYHLDAEPRTLDPQIAEDSSSLLIIQAIYEGLARLDENGDPYPGAAESWDANADFTQFTFHLREDAVWSSRDADGNTIPVTAHDFVYAFRRAVAPRTGSQTCEPLYCIQNAQQIRSGELPVESLGV